MASTNSRGAPRHDRLPSPPRMSHHAPIAFGSREDAEEAIGLYRIEWGEVMPAEKPRDCMVYFPVGAPAFSGKVYLDRHGPVTDACWFIHDIDSPVHASLVKSWKKTGSMVETSANAGVSISVTAAALVLSGDIDPRDPRIQGLKQTSAERMEYAHEADPVDALRLLRRALPDEREVQIKAAAAIMALSSGLEGGNRDQVISSLVAAETLVARSDRPSVAMEGLASASAKAELFYKNRSRERQNRRDHDRRHGAPYGRD